jgi:hypothetical protein
MTGYIRWAVPNTITSQALIRINNVGNTSLFDVSNGVFTINLPTPILTSPNGGETWRSGQTHTVTWDANTVASNVKLEYSRDNGVNWGVITNSTTNTGSYTWTIPMFTTTEQALVRITNTSFPSAIDTSDAVFTIKAPITIDYPVNVNDTLTSCSTINIQISKSSNFENYTSGSTCYSTSTTYRTTFQTYYKVNGSNTWMSIGTQYGTCYTDYYYQSFAIPDIAPGEIKFLVIGSYSSTNGGGQYWQDSTEYIQVKNPSGTIVVTNPNGGVTMNALTPYNITWTANGTSGFFDVQYGIGGTSYSTISGASNISGNSYTWTVPNTTSSNVYIRVRDYLNNCRKDQSDAANTIIPAQPILTSPNGGEVWKVNSNQNITWNTSTFYTNVNIEYSTDGGTNWNIVVSATPNDGAHSWAVPNTITSQALIRISNVGNPSLFDVSNALFTINLPTPILTSPNGGEVWRSGQTHTITWDANTVASNVKLEYSRDNGVNWGVITNSTTNTGTFTWIIPMFVTTEQALVRITNTSFPSAIDTSNAVFTIRAPILISFPINVNDTLTTCNSINVLFNKNTNFENRVVSSACTNTPTANRNSFETFYKLNDGSNTWISMGSTTYGSCGTDSYSDNLVIPDVPAGAIKFLVIGYNHTSGSEYWQDSTAYIPLKTPNGTIVVTNPNGGVNLNALTSYNITWTANGTSGFFDVQYGNGTTFSTISGATNISGNSYTWTVPNTTNSNIYVRVRDNQNICRKDNSDAANTIIPAQPILTAPNGGEVWKVNSNQNITWNTSTFYTNVNIEYSTDGGVNWNIVISSTPNDGAHTWAVPNTITSQALIRINNVGNH